LLISGSIVAIILYGNRRPLGIASQNLSALGWRLFFKERSMSPLGLILIVVLIVVLMGGGYGYRSGNNVLAGGGGIVGLILIIVLILFLMGRI
jgi:hypothetical protein